jgi:kinetochore protein Nuf2
MAKGIFPRMDTGEIIAALEGWGFPVTNQQLAHPTSDFVENVYFACLQQVTELNQENLRQPVQEVLDAAQIDERVSEWLMLRLPVDHEINSAVGTLRHSSG